jgi:PAS domain
MFNSIGQRAEQPRFETMFIASASAAEMSVDRFSPVVRHVFDYWRRRAADRMPSRADIDPTELPLALPNLILWDVAGACEQLPAGWPARASAMWPGASCAA